MTGASRGRLVSFWTIEASVTASRSVRSCAAARVRSSGVKFLRKLAIMLSTIWRADVDRVTTYVSGNRKPSRSGAPGAREATSWGS